MLHHWLLEDYLLITCYAHHFASSILQQSTPHGYDDTTPNKKHIVSSIKTQQHGDRSIRYHHTFRIALLMPMMVFFLIHRTHGSKYIRSGEKQEEKGFRQALSPPATPRVHRLLSRVFYILIAGHGEPMLFGDDGGAVIDDGYGKGVPHQVMFSKRLYVPPPHYLVYRVVLLVVLLLLLPPPAGRSRSIWIGTICSSLTIIFLYVSAHHGDDARKRKRIRLESECDGPSHLWRRLQFFVPHVNGTTAVVLCVIIHVIFCTACSTSRYKKKKKWYEHQVQYKYTKRTHVHTEHLINTRDVDNP